MSVNTTQNKSMSLRVAKGRLLRMNQRRTIAFIVGEVAVGLLKLALSLFIAQKSLRRSTKAFLVRLVLFSLNHRHFLREEKTPPIQLNRRITFLVSKWRIDVADVYIYATIIATWTQHAYCGHCKRRGNHRRDYKRLCAHCTPNLVVRFESNS